LLSRSTPTRAIAALATAALTLSLVVASATSVLAGETRHLYVGSGPVSDATNGVLTLTPVSVGGVTATNVIVKNVDNQTLTHVVLTFAAPLSTSGLTLSGIFGPNSDLCLPSPATAPLVCDFSNLAKNQTRTFTVLYDATSAGNGSIAATVTFNETKPNNGSNTHIDAIGGSADIAAFNCDSAVTFLAPGKPHSVGTDTTTCPLTSSNRQDTKVEIPGTVVSAVTVGEVDSALCSGNLPCFGQASYADVAVDGKYTVRWTIVWSVASNFNVQQFGVLHFPDGATSATPPDLNLTLKKNTCKSDTQVPCIESVTLDGTTLTAVIRTAGNGVMRGY
jgi:hypothetical protein